MISTQISIEKISLVPEQKFALAFHLKTGFIVKSTIEDIEPSILIMMPDIFCFGMKRVNLNLWNSSN